MKRKSKKLIEAFYYLEEHPTESLTKVAKKFAVDRHSLSGPTKLEYKNYSIISQVDPENLYWFSEKELATIEYYQSSDTITYTDVIKKFGIPKKSQTFNNWLEIFGIQKHVGYKYKYDRSKFFNIDNEEEAYWLGFILADGYLNEDKNFLQIKLAKRDQNHLVKFANFLGLTKTEITEIIKEDIGGAYNRDNICSMIRISSKEIVQNLKKYNVRQAKSTKEIPYCFNNVKLETAYIRGILDGDGYIRKTLNGFGIVGSYKVLEYIKNFINNNIINIENNNITKKGTIYCLEFNNKEKTKTILNFFYKNASIYLDRKYELYTLVDCRE